MFGLTFEKVMLLAVLAGFLLGPDRLPAAAQRLGELARGARRLLSDAESRVKQEMGPEFDTVDWRQLDPRRYDPRRVIRDALRESAEPTPTARRSTPPEGGDGPG